MDNMKTALVTGGGGFVGRKIVDMLLEKGLQVKVIGRNEYADLAAKGVECLRGDICDEAFVKAGLAGVDTVFHTAALAGVWGKWSDYYRINVAGTENVIKGCKSQSVKRLVYTSTPSVVFNRQDIQGGDESLPYATEFLCNYAKSKVMAEKAVLEALDKNLSGCAIRPHLIYGPNDPHLLPRLVSRGKANKLKIVGSGMNRVDISYVDNVAHLHILAAEDLCSRRRSNGKVYFIGDEKPVNLWKWINELFERLGIQKIEKKVSEKTAYKLGSFLETLYTVAKSKKEPPMTRFVAEQLAKSHYFSHERAKNDLGYKPIVTDEQAMENVIRWLQDEDKKTAV